MFFDGIVNENQIASSKFASIDIIADRTFPIRKGIHNVFAFIVVQSGAKTVKVFGYLMFESS